jgi:hypothetical protein
MKSRRRIAFLKAWDHANRIDDYSRDLPLAKWGSGVSLQSSNLTPPMSALGQKRTLRLVHLMSALPPKADIVHDDGRTGFEYGSRAFGRCAVH